MGMYTEIYVNVDLEEDTPEHVIRTLKAMTGGGGGVDEKYPARWGLLFNSGSYYTPNTSCAALTFDEIGNQWSLLGKGDIKNYEKEIEAFFAWLAPFVEGDSGSFIGYSRYEESRVPELFFLP